MSQYDEIFIEGIKCYSTIGINNWEKNTKQPLIININLLMKKIDNNNADNINETINYKSVSYSVKELVENNTYELIETMGKDIALLCLKNEKVIEAKIKINKPNALKISHNVGVVITRGKNEN
jgi:FolB domain-containing protein|tara:strand:+ start:6736 stop:7104 length:369 start_codon:yes stop_codon:yes gene_type:complete